MRNPPARQDYYYFKCKAPGEPSGSDSREEKDKKISEIQGFPPVSHRYNIHEGAPPYVPVAVEDVPNYFTENSWKTCITTIRTIGRVRRLEHEFYLIESVDEFADPVQVPLTRGTNRELRPFVSSTKDKKLGLKNKKKKIKKKHGDKKESDETEDTNAKKPIKAKELPFPDSVRDPSTLGDTRVENGAVYMLLGKLEWANGKPIIDVHRFIPVHDLKTTYETFMLQYVIARREMEYYKAHPAEITEIIRKPNEIRKPIITQPQKKRPWKR